MAFLVAIEAFNIRLVDGIDGIGGRGSSGSFLSFGWHLGGEGIGGGAIILPSDLSLKDPGVDFIGLEVHDSASH